MEVAAEAPHHNSHRHHRHYHLVLLQQPLHPLFLVKDKGGTIALFQSLNNLFSFLPVSGEDEYG
jgi:hypothetical protein